MSDMIYSFSAISTNHYIRAKKLQIAMSNPKYLKHRSSVSHICSKILFIVGSAAFMNSTFFSADKVYAEIINHTRTWDF